MVLDLHLIEYDSYQEINQYHPTKERKLSSRNSIERIYLTKTIEKVI